MKQILVIGSKGMLGQEFIKQLHGKDVVGWGREDVDIANAAEVARKIGDLKPDLIINCAAYNNVDKAEDEPSLANAINGEAVGYLAASAVECGAAFVHFSTDYVFDGSRQDGYSEEDLPNPVSVYGQSKALGEQRLLSVFGHPEEQGDEGSRTNLCNAHTREILRFAQNDNGVKWYIIRTSRLFGQPGIGATSKKSFPEMMLKFAREKGRIEAIDAEVSSPTYVKDLAEATLNLFPPLRVRGGVEGLRPSGIYHLSNSGSCTWYGYAKAAIEAAGVQAEVVPVGPERFPRKAKRSAFSVLLNTKLSLLRPWQEALQEFLRG